jgi:hypothetical protein
LRTVAYNSSVVAKAHTSARVRWLCVNRPIRAVARAVSRLKTRRTQGHDHGHDGKSAKGVPWQMAAFGLPRSRVRVAPVHLRGAASSPQAVRTCKLLSAILQDCGSFPNEAKANPFTKRETMKHKTILAIAVGAISLLACSAITQAEDRPSSGPNYVNGPESGKARHVRRRRPMQVDIYSTRRRHGYSYSAADVVSTSGSNPPPYLDVRQSPGGPFYSGFWFDPGIVGPYGGNSPYLH